jgi:predicted nucleic acid-binding protein
MSSYDASYVALAELLEAPLLTADARLARSNGARCPIEVV